MSILKDIDTPVFYAEGMPKNIERKNYKLLVDGFIKDKEKFFTFDEIEKMPFITVNDRLTSVSGWSVRALWRGVKFCDFLGYISLKPEASHVFFRSFNNYTTCLPLNELLKDNVILCYMVNEEYLEKEYGSPLRLIVPNLWGYKSIKGISQITFTNRQILGYWEKRGYSDDAKIEDSLTLDINTKKIRSIVGGKVKE